MTKGILLDKDNGQNKIAIIGSAPSSIHLAPYNDRSWSIWGCSPGAYGPVPRSDVWFEVHRWEPSWPGKNNSPSSKPWFSAEFTAFLASHPNVIMTQKEPTVPNSQPYPYREMIDKYGNYHFTSQITLMLALAIECKPEMIGLWGVDMAAHSEYAYQRPGCQHFIGLAVAQGIKVLLPPESDLMRPPPIYGLHDHDERVIKNEARLAELTKNRDAYLAQADQASKQALFLNGAIDDLNYQISNSYVGNFDWVEAISGTRYGDGNVDKVGLYRPDPDAGTPTGETGEVLEFNPPKYAEDH